MSNKKKEYPREEWIEFITETNQNGEIELNYSIDKFGDLSGIDNLKDSPFKHIRSYKGESREKKLSVIGSGETPSFNQERFAFENFERIYFIDTNDSIFRGNKSCSTAVYELFYFKNALEKCQGNLNLKFLVGYYQFDVLEEAKGERIGWHLFIESTRKYFESIGDDKQVLVVTDHELGLHENINSRESAYYLDFYLPRNVTLGFAKADKSGSVLEIGMKNADRMSNIIKKDFAKYENVTLKIQKLNYDNNFRGYAVVHPNKLFGA
ncbi:hypothetical protein ACRRS0_15140 [Agarivorans sp. QJM3NY_29]|uniref:hypothetical protein n=1 Tax=unclassified Agarivorans TaxID=2636026 RepID=UPI003D7E8AFE